MSKQKPLPGDTHDPRGMNALLRRFLDHLQVLNYSPDTIDHRRKYLSYFIGWAEQRSLTKPSEITPHILERYQRHLAHAEKANGEALSVRSQLHHLVSLRCWFKWLTKHRHTLYNPASELDLPRLGHRLPKFVLTASEAEKVLAMPNTNTAAGIRDRAILEVFYSTGIRRTELIRLGVHGLDAERGVLTVRQGKGKKDRFIPIGERAIFWVEKYRREVRPRVAITGSGTTLFLTRDGEPMKTDTLTQWVRGYVNAADLGKTGSCHLFRHTVATLMLEGGADVRFVQQMLGHADLSTTAIYTQVSIRMLKAVHQATHPGKLTRDEGPQT